MPSFSDQYLAYVSRRYPTHTTASTLWEAAGGDIAEIEDQTASLDRWARLLRLAEGGAVKPFALTLAALQRDPHNSMLLMDLRGRLPEGVRQHADSTVQQVLDAPDPESASRVLAQLGDLGNPEIIAATVVATEQAEEKKRGAREVVIDVLKTAGNETVKFGFGLLTSYLTGKGPGQ